MNAYHTPILVEEIMTGLNVGVGKRYVDATFGGGGHSKEIVQRGGLVLGIDADSDAIRHWENETHINNKDHVQLVQGNFRMIESIVQSHGWVPVDGVLFDLGVSSHEIDEQDRGFSFRFPDAPLDMRFSQKGTLDARTFLATASKEELYEVFAKYGEEERADAICNALVRARSVKPIEKVSDLVTIIEKITGKGIYGRGAVTRIFQAIRIAVNDEMNALKEGLRGAKHILPTGGRIAVISFHSLEDRTVKRFFDEGGWKVITKKPVMAGPEEQERNSRSRSAKLRIAEKI